MTLTYSPPPLDIQPGWPGAGSKYVFSNFERTSGGKHVAVGLRLDGVAIRVLQFDFDVPEISYTYNPAVTLGGGEYVSGYIMVENLPGFGESGTAAAVVYAAGDGLPDNMRVLSLAADGSVASDTSLGIVGRPIHAAKMTGGATLLTYLASDSSSLCVVNTATPGSPVTLPNATQGDATAGRAVAVRTRNNANTADVLVIAGYRNLGDSTSGHYVFVLDDEGTLLHTTALLTDAQRLAYDADSYYAGTVAIARNQATDEVHVILRLDDPDSFSGQQTQLIQRRVSLGSGDTPSIGAIELLSAAGRPADEEYDAGIATTDDVRALITDGGSQLLVTARWPDFSENIASVNLPDLTADTSIALVDGTSNTFSVAGLAVTPTGTVALLPDGYTNPGPVSANIVLLYNGNSDGGTVGCYLAMSLINEEFQQGNSLSDYQGLTVYDSEDAEVTLPTEPISFSDFCGKKRAPSRAAVDAGDYSQHSRTFLWSPSFSQLTWRYGPVAAAQLADPIATESTPATIDYIWLNYVPLRFMSNSKVPVHVGFSAGAVPEGISLFIGGKQCTQEDFMGGNFSLSAEDARALVGGGQTSIPLSISIRMPE